MALESPSCSPLGSSFSLPDVSMANLSDIALTLLNVTPSDLSYVVNRFTENVRCLEGVRCRMRPTSKNS